MSKPKALYILGSGDFEKIYAPDQRKAIAELVDVSGSPQTPASVKASPDLLSDVEIVLSGWGGPCLDADFLAAAPKLKAFFYGAGTLKHNITDVVWDRKIIVTSAYAANAIPVAEFTLAQIILVLKQFYRHSAACMAGERRADISTPGTYGTTVALISMGMIGRLVRKLLLQLDVRVLAYDPFLTKDEAVTLDVEPVGLDEAFSRAAVVSLHTPLLPETIKMITGDHFKQMKQGAAFINTSRGRIIDESALIDTLKARPDLTAILDVTYPEPPDPESQLYQLPNVVLSPHIAGSMELECRRMGQYVVNEVQRYVDGQPQIWPIDQEMFARLA